MSSDVAVSSGSVHQLNELVERNGVASLNEKAGKPSRAVEAEGVAAKEQNADIKSQKPTDIFSERIANNNKVEEQEIDQAIEVVSNFMNQPPRNVNFTKHDDSGKTVIKVFDKTNNELIKQFPSEEILMIAGKISSLHQEVEQQTGIFLDESI